MHPYSLPSSNIRLFMPEKQIIEERAERLTESKILHIPDAAQNPGMAGRRGDRSEFCASYFQPVVQRATADRVLVSAKSVALQLSSCPAKKRRTRDYRTGKETPNVARAW